MKCSVDRLEKAWGLAFKSLTVREVTANQAGGAQFSQPRAFLELRFTIEFAKDGDRKAVEKAFTPGSVLGRAVGKGRDPHVLFYLFDEDNVVVQKLLLERPEGEITGVAGDAFRAIVLCEPEAYKKVKKIELRPSEVEK
ncbi:MAG: hypothetical protein C0501_29635 [Isosphaera sp.]|nr:hypothetical protein [Isosphaera sp.]